MRTLHTLPFLLGALLMSVAPVANADDDRGGRGHGHGKDRYERKEEFWDGNCKVERKWERDGDYKEERKCKGQRSRPRHVEAPPPPRVHAVPARAQVAYPPWIVVQQGAPVYAPQHRPAAPSGGMFQCNSSTVGQVLGGVIGGVLGNQIGGGSGRAIATVGGAVAGVLVGGEIGRRVDSADQACVARVLEYAPTGERVEWSGNGNQYAVVPGAATRQRNGHCRPFVLETRTAYGWESTPSTACRRSDGVWVARL